MKIKSKVFLIMLIIGILICNISYAAIITTQKLETSIKKLFGQNITIVTNAGGNTTQRVITASNATLANSQIKITEASTGQSFYINYGISGDVCKFESTLDLSQVNQIEGVDPMVLQTMLPIYQAAYVELCYLTTADALGVDLSLADTYYYQKTNGQVGTIQNDVFTYTQTTNNNISNIALSVNAAQLAQLDSSKISSSSSCTVTLEKGNTDTGNGSGATNTPTQQPSTNTGTQTTTPSTQKPSTNTSTNTNQSTTKPSTSTSTSTNTNKKPTTNNIPKAGLEDNIVIAIIAFAVIGIFFYIKNKQNRDIM